MIHCYIYGWLFHCCQDQLVLDTENWIPFYLSHIFIYFLGMLLRCNYYCFSMYIWKVWISYQLELCTRLIYLEKFGDYRLKFIMLLLSSIMLNQNSNIDGKLIRLIFMSNQSHKCNTFYYFTLTDPHKFNPDKNWCKLF